jgi:hypothetical protein
MPARDRYHDAVKNALVKDGWTITDDPLHLVWGRKDLYVDLGAERVLGATKGGQKIAVEVKTFASESDVFDLEVALGQYTLYHDVMVHTEPDRILYLAVRHETWQEVFEEPIGQLVLDNKRLRLVTFDEQKEVILQWIP